MSPETTRQESDMKRTAILTAVTIGMALAGATPSLAFYEGPWCVKASLGRSAIEICHFQTIEQCLTERPFYGNSAFCVQNARYLPYWRPRAKYVRDVR